MQFDEFSGILENAFSDNNISHLITQEISQKLYVLTQLLTRENEKYNLTAIKDVRNIIYKHYADSLLISRHIGANSTLVDIGSGAGFPALPLAIAHPDLNITAIDSTAKKVAFINSCSAELKLNNITALSTRAEDLAHNPKYRARFNYATARAVSALPIICELAIPFLIKNGIFLAMKGNLSDEEHKNTLQTIRQLNCEEVNTESYSLNISTESEYRSIVIIKKIEKTPDNFPRNYAQITKKPLV